MNAPTPQDAVARLGRASRSSLILGWALGSLLVLSGVGVAVSPGLRTGRVRAEGTVIKVEHEVQLVQHGNAQAGDIVWFEEVLVGYPVVEYQAGGRKYTTRSSSSLALGQNVPVLYKVDRPSAATVDTFADRWFGPLMLGGALAGLGICALAAMIARTRMLHWPLPAA